jgi:hypothetical protein
MATRRSPRRPPRPSRAARRRRRRLVGAVVGTALAAAGGWLLAPGGSAAPPAASSLRPIPPELRLGQGPGDLRATGAGLEVGILDTVEMLPRCHP